MRWGSPGSGRLRRALVGSAVGDRLALRLARDSGSLVTIPLAAMTVHDAATGGRDNPWPAIDFHKAAATISLDILEACPARLYRRSADVGQAGYMLNMFDMSYPNTRQGKLTWSALEAACATRKVRLEIGPLYFRNGSLYNWRYTYQELTSAGVGWQLFGLSTPGWLLIAGLVALPFVARYLRRRGRT
jgi:hypothetical protein